MVIEYRCNVIESDQSLFFSSNERDEVVMSDVAVLDPMFDSG